MFKLYEITPNSVNMLRKGNKLIDKNFPTIIVTCVVALSRLYQMKGKLNRNTELNFLNPEYESSKILKSHITHNYSFCIGFALRFLTAAPSVF